jgi:hypothetical protein
VGPRVSSAAAIKDADRRKRRVIRVVTVTPARFIGPPCIIVVAEPP